MRPKITGMLGVRDIPPCDRHATAMRPPCDRHATAMRPPCDRHAVIFQHHGTLAPGETFELRNNHDPRALNYQFETEHLEKATWEFLEEGRKAWRVSIGRP